VWLNNRQAGRCVTFQQCSLSLNGTNVLRGQIPFLQCSHNDKSIRPPTVTGDDACKCFLMVLRMLCTKLLDCLAAGMVPCNQWLFACVFGWTGMEWMLQTG
jgi:hypothetical protein